MALGLESAGPSLAESEAAAQVARRVRLDTISAQMAASWTAFQSQVQEQAQATVAACDDAGLSAIHPSVSADGRGFVTALSGCRVRLPSSASSTATAEEHARSWVHTNAALFGLSGSDFGAEGRSSLMTKRQRERLDGATLVRFSQVLDDAPVYTSGLRVFVHPGGLIGRVVGHLTPTWAIDSVPETTLTPAQAIEVAGSALGATTSAAWSTQLGVYDRAVHDEPGAAPRWVLRVRPADLPAAPYVFVDAVDGKVLGTHARSAGLSWDNDLTATQKAVETFHQAVEECTDFDEEEEVCDTHAGSASCKTIDGVDECGAGCGSCGAENCILGVEYTSYFEPEMLQHATLIVTAEAENQCDESGDQRWSYCTYNEGTCTEGEEDCTATALPRVDVGLESLLKNTSRMFYEWMQRIGWDDETAHARFRRLRAVTDFCGSGGSTTCDIHDELDVGSGYSPARWLDENALIAVSEDLAADPDVNALPFAVGHEALHGVDFAEANVKASSAATAHWISEGLAEVSGVLLTSYIEDDTGSACPIWHKGAVECGGAGEEDCPCGFEGANIDYGAPSASQMSSCTIQTRYPDHLTEALIGVEDCDEADYHWYIISRIVQLLGQCSSSETHHGITVQSVASGSTGFDYIDLALLLHDALVALPSVPALNELRDELIDAADTIEGGSGSYLGANTLAATDAVGFWSLDTDPSLDVADSSGAALGSVNPAGGRDQYWFGFFEGANELGFFSQDCDFDGTCTVHQTSGAEMLATDAKSGPTVVSFDDYMFVVYADTSDRLRTIVLDEDGEEVSGWTDPWEDDDEALTDVMPALVRYTDITAGEDSLWLFFKEVGSGAQDIRVMSLDDIDVESPGGTWVLHTEPSSPDEPLETAFGVAAASSHEDSEGTGADRVYVAFVDDSNDARVALWRFDPSDTDDVSTTLYVGEVVGSFDDRIAGVNARPVVAFYRDMLHVVAYGWRPFWDDDPEEDPEQTVLYTRCELDGSDDCDEWSWLWPMQGNTSTRPSFLAGALNDMSDKLRLLEREDIGGSGDEGLLFRSKRSD